MPFFNTLNNPSTASSQSINTGSFLTTGTAASLYYALSNPSGFITGKQLANGSIGINQTPLYFNIDSTNIGNSYGGFGIGAAGNVTIYPNNNLLLNPAAGWKVGIQNNSPVYDLDVIGSGNFSNGVYINGSGLAFANQISVTTNTTITGSYTIQSPSGSFFDGQKKIWRITQGGSGNNPISLGTGFRIPASTSLVASTGVGSTDVFGAIYNSGSNTWDVTSFVPGYSATGNSFSYTLPSYVTTSQTGQFYPASNPSGFALQNSLTGYLPITGGTTLGKNTFAKAGYNVGDLMFDNGTTDTPGTLFYYSGNKNFGIDSYYNSSSNKQYWRITKNLNESGGTELMQVDLSGNLNLPLGVVTMPMRPAFRVVGNGGAVSATTTLTSGNWTLDYQQGNSLNQSNGIFTAPISGLYSVHLVARTNSNSLNAISQAVVIKSGLGASSTTVQAMLEFGNNTSMNHAGVSTISRLGVGDTLKLSVLAGTIIFDGNDNWTVAYIG